VPCDRDDAPAVGPRDECVLHRGGP
jgi:hypothetical protein